MGLRVRAEKLGFAATAEIGVDHVFRSYERIPRQEIDFYYDDIVRVEAADPWPSFAITHLVKADTEATRAFHPLRVHSVLSFTPSNTELERFEEVVVQLFEVLRQRVPGAVVEGWLGVPHEPWQRVEELPSGKPVSRSGAYRTAADKVVARRKRPGPFEALLTWLASSPEKPWRKTTREVVMTYDHLYVEHWNGDKWRVPVSTLRTRLANEYDDIVYVFGRRNFLILPARKNCPVRERLDEILETRG